MKRIKYYFGCIKWCWLHRTEPNNRSKWRRMARDVSLERDEKCRYCRDGVYHDVMGTPCKYNYCPMCGKKLKGVNE